MKLESQPRRGCMFIAMGFSPWVNSVLNMRHRKVKIELHAIWRGLMNDGRTSVFFVGWLLVKEVNKVVR